MKRRVFVVAFMLLSVAALGLSNGPAGATVTVEAFDFCSDCASQCWNEANTTYDECRWDENGNAINSEFACDNRVIDYYNRCVTVFCNGAGCTVPTKEHRYCKFPGNC